VHPQQIQLPSAVLLAHAILMLLAFGVLLPTGLLLARHKWLFVSEEQVSARQTTTALECCRPCHDGAAHAATHCVDGIMV
jgi:hypothetical protein